MARLGSSQPVEVLTDRAALIESFDIGQFGLAPTKFDAEDMKLHSAKTLRAMAFEAVADRLADLGVGSDLAPAFWAAIGPNLDRMDQVPGWLDLLQNGAEPKIDTDDAVFVAEAMALLPAQPWDGETWGTWTKAVKEATGRKGRALFQPLRRALTGQDHGPDMGALMPLMQAPVSGRTT